MPTSVFTYLLPKSSKVDGYCLKIMKTYKVGLTVLQSSSKVFYSS